MIAIQRQLKDKRVFCAMSVALRQMAKSFEDIDPVMHARLESFICFAFSYNHQSKKKKSAIDLINAYNDQLPANETPAEMIFFQKYPCYKTDVHC
jgi:hypothetical protein